MVLIEDSISHSVRRYLSRGYLHNVALEHSGKAWSECWLPSMESMERQTFSKDNLKHLVWAPAQNWPPEKSISVCTVWVEGLAKPPNSSGRGTVGVTASQFVLCYLFLRGEFKSQYLCYVPNSVRRTRAGIPSRGIAWRVALPLWRVHFSGLSPIVSQISGQFSLDLCRKPFTRFRVLSRVFGFETRFKKQNSKLLSSLWVSGPRKRKGNSWLKMHQCSN